MRTQINEIATQMVACALTCRGVARIPNEGILPRCLILEDEGRAGSSGAIVCGLNPAKSSTRERGYYIAEGVNYNSVTTYWQDCIRNIPYYRKLRTLVNALGLTGPILWTDTVKCEKQGDAFSHNLFPDTVRRCAANYLRRELAICPSNWIAIGVGRDAFTTLSLLCHDRFVLGVPHCTGQYSNARFDTLFDQNRLKPEVLLRFFDAQKIEQTGALWLGE